MLDTTVFFDATVLDVIVLGIIGVLVSACIWAAVQALREKLGWTSPLSPRQKLVVTWGPLILGVLAGLGLFPLALAGVGAGWPAELESELRGVSVIAGGVGGVGARIAHDRARELLEATWGWLLNRIGGPDVGDEE